MSTPLVSIALCTFNGEAFLREQLDSIINQSYINLEIIIVDDLSTDGTFEIIKQYQKIDGRIRLYQNDSTLGYNKNFERALKLCSGQFIAISDQDDIWDINKIEALINNIGNNWLIFSNSALMASGGSLTGDKLLNSFHYSQRDYRSILFMNFVTGHTTLLAREFLNYVLPFPPNGFYDWWLGFVALYHHKLVYFNQTLTSYRIHPQSVMQVNQHDKVQTELKNFHLITTMLNEFLNYKKLLKKDAQFITELRDAFSNKINTPYSLSLIKIIYKNYDVLFPDIKPRKGLVKLNFAIRFARALKSTSIKK